MTNTPAADSLFDRSTAVHVGLAALAMGGWAAFVNSQAPLPAVAAAALTQATLSGAITAGLKHSLERVSARLMGQAALIVPPSLTCVATLALLFGAHTLAHTADIWRTIAVPWGVSSTYAWLYSLDLQRRRGFGPKAAG